MKDSAKNKLKKNTSPAAVLSIISNAKEAEKKIIAWKLVAGKKITVDVHFRVIRRFRDELVVCPVSKKDEAKLSDLVLGAKSLNFYIPDEMVLFQSEIKSSFSNGDLTLRFPELIAQIDRRKHLRLLLPEFLGVKVKFFREISSFRTSSRLFEKNCFDISAGGFSFILSKTEARFFKGTKDISLLSLRIGDKEIKTGAEIISMLEISPNSDNKLNYRAIKVCVRFHHISEKDMSYINDFVFQHIDLDTAI